MMIELIEQGSIESIYSVDVSRLFRDTDLIQAPEFAQLCKKHNVIIVLDGADRLNLKDKTHYDYFIGAAKRAGEEIETMVTRLGHARREKISFGLYGGGNVSAGYYVDLNPENVDTHGSFFEYKPHAEICRELFMMAYKLGSISAILRECHRTDIYYPAFKPSIAKFMATRSALRICPNRRDSDGNLIGYEITREHLRYLFKNIFCAGILINEDGEVNEGKIPPIVSVEMFTMANEALYSNRTKPRGKRRPNSHHLLEGLLFSECTDGEMRPAYFSARAHNAHDIN